jgi:aspartyl-tRNA(Asn)/glutamyl-tRNA(Gln) amidotransferase subunit A
MVHSDAAPAMVSMTANPAFATLGELRAALDEGELTSRDLVELFLERIARWQSTLNAFVTVFEDSARLAAEASDLLRRAGIKAGPLHGIPFVAKDLFDVAGWPTGAGSQALPVAPATENAAAITRLQAAGMILLGKTQTVEFAFGGWGTNPVCGTPRNPWRLDRHYIPGGSSSGTAVAVAAGLAPCGIGTDTGGSVRTPAALCGLVGMKTSPGRISRAGLFPLSPSHDTIGPLARSVADCALLAEAMAGPDPRDPATLVAPWGARQQAAVDDAGHVRIAVLPESELQDIHPDVAAHVAAALSLLQRAGAHLVPIRLPRTITEYMHAAGDIMSAESYAALCELVDDAASPVCLEVRSRILRGRDISATRYQQLLKFRRQAQEEFAAALGNADVLAAPTTPLPAVPVEMVDEAITPTSRFGRFVNLIDYCSVAVPSGVTAEGLPTSIQFIARCYDEGTALRIAARLEGLRGRFPHPAGLS